MARQLHSQSTIKYKSKWRNIWIVDVFCYQYTQDTCPRSIMMLVRDRARVFGVYNPFGAGTLCAGPKVPTVPTVPTAPTKTRLE